MDDIGEHWSLSANKEKSCHWGCYTPISFSFHPQKSILHTALAYFPFTWCYCLIRNFPAICLTMFRHVSDRQIFSDDDDMSGTRDINRTETWPCHGGAHLLVGRQAHKQVIAAQSGTCNDGRAYKVLWQQRWGKTKFTLEGSGRASHWKGCQGLKGSKQDVQCPLVSKGFLNGGPSALQPHLPILPTQLTSPLLLDQSPNYFLKKSTSDPISNPSSYVASSIRHPLPGRNWTLLSAW